MRVKADLIVKILEESRLKDRVELSSLISKLNISVDRLVEFIRDFEREGLLKLCLSNDTQYCRPLNRLKLAYRAIELGANIKSVALALNWREFEEICADAFRANGYEVYRSFRFRVWKKYYEIDVIGVRRPLVVCVDCKRWSIGRFSLLHKCAEQHYAKIEHLSKNRTARFKLKLDSWSKIVFIPVILTVHEDRMSIYRGIPIVPLFKFNSFLNELTLGLDLIRRIEVKS